MHWIPDTVAHVGSGLGLSQAREQWAYKTIKWWELHGKNKPSYLMTRHSGIHLPCWSAGLFGGRMQVCWPWKWNILSSTMRTLYFIPAIWCQMQCQDGFACFTLWCWMYPVFYCTLLISNLKWTQTQALVRVIALPLRCAVSSRMAQCLELLTCVMLVCSSLCAMYNKRFSYNAIAAGP